MREMLEFDHHKLDAYRVALEAMVRGMKLLARLPRGYAKLKDQGERALQGAFTQTAEGAARVGADRAQRLRVARAEAGEAAAVLEGLEQLAVVAPAESRAVRELLWRLCAMLTRLGGLGRR
jgi:four helix bundle protein